MNLHLYDVIQGPCITEKGSKQAALGKFFFEVHRTATKQQIKDAVEQIYHVSVTRVNTVTMHGRWKRVRMQPGKTSDWKKAIVTLKKDQKIEFT